MLDKRIQSKPKLTVMSNQLTAEVLDKNTLLEDTYPE
jgi:hypothetical protein